MTRYVALLRGINLGSRNKVSMADLRQLFLELGHADVRTYVQSGNVVFQPAVSDIAQLRAEIESGIEEALGLKVAVLIRTNDELARMVGNNPFVRRASGPAALHVTFLEDRPEPQRVAVVDPASGEPDEFLIDGREVYLHCPNGYGRSKLSNSFFEKQLGVVATTRNWRTVSTLHQLASG